MLLDETTQRKVCSSCMSDSIRSRIRSRLANLLQAELTEDNTLRCKESSNLEFKESFNLGSASKYIRTMIAFANNEGGYIVFGIEPDIHRIIGVNRRRIIAFDPEEMESILKDYVEPALTWHCGYIDIAEASVWYIYTEKAHEKPVMVKKGSGSSLKMGEIYYRYEGQTRVVQYSELRQIIDERLERERNAWIQLIQRISKAGPTNVGILDTISGKLYGDNVTYLIDESLTKKLKFIQKGSFSEVEGEPTLRLVGDVTKAPTTELISQQKIPEGIHVNSLIEVFLTEKELNEQVARIYLKESARQNTHVLPVHYFIKKSDLSASEAADLIDKSPGPFKKNRTKIIKRIIGEKMIEKIGREPRLAYLPVIDESFDLAKQLRESPRPLEAREVLVSVLKQNPSIIMGSISSVPLVRLCEAVTHIGLEDLRRNRTEIFSVFVQIFQSQYDEMNGNNSSYFRQAVAYIDQKLYKENDN